MFLKLLLVLSNTLISAVLIIAAPHASRSMISSLSLAVLHNSMNYLIIDFVYHTSPQPPRLWLEATAVSESVTFTWIQDSESWPGVPVETIRFTCCEGPHFSGKRLPSKIFPNLDDDHKMVVLALGFHEIFCADACKELGSPAPSSQSPWAPVDCPERWPLRRVQRLGHWRITAAPSTLPNSRGVRFFTCLCYGFSLASCH